MAATFEPSTRNVTVAVSASIRKACFSASLPAWGLTPSTAAQSATGVTAPPVRRTTDAEPSLRNSSDV